MTDLLRSLARWNRWGNATLRSGFPRDVVSTLLPFLDTPEVVGLVGPRRAGKSTVLVQVMDALEARGVTREAMLHVNAEEPGLADHLDPRLLDRLYETFRSEVCPRGKAWLFLDEVQAIPQWERWVRARNETEDIKVFVTGSSSALLSRELGTLLTGRHVTFEVWPLSFTELLRFRGLALPARPDLVPAPPDVQRALFDYLQWGGFPEVVLATDDERRDVLLRQYFDDVLFKDVALRHAVRDLPALRAAAVHLLTNTASLVSANRLAAQLDVSVDLAQQFCTYLEEAFLVSFLPFFSLKLAERRRRPQKVHAVDTGLRNAVCLSGAPDRGRLLETAVVAELRRGRHDGLFYWKGRGEVDVVVRRGNEATRLVQVTWGGEADVDVLRRESAALEEAGQVFPGVARSCVVGEEVSPRAAVEGLPFDVERFATMGKPDRG
jgi:predicted AAA+ superfamily ATPase